MKSIPTIYGGTRFRSRLEARWASFFDLLGWEYEYEPFDLDGWIPDFMLAGSTRILVEVKPITRFNPKFAAEMAKGWLSSNSPEWLALAEERRTLTGQIKSSSDTEQIAELLNRVQKVAQRADAAASEYELLLIGTRVFECEDYDDTPAIGWLGGRELCEGDEAALVKYPRDCDNHLNVPDDTPVMIGVASSTMSYQDRITGRYNGGSLGGVTLKQGILLFREAGNVVRWQGEY